MASDSNGEIEELRARLQEAQDTLDAIRRGEVDGLVVSTPKGEQVYTMSGAEKPYRLLIEEMREGAIMLSEDNTILYCNSGFAKMTKFPLERIVGTKIENRVSPSQKGALKKLISAARTGKGVMTKGIAFQTKDDVLVPTQVSINSLQMGGTSTTFLVVTDLAEHMDEEVKRYTKELEIAQLALAESEQRWATTLASIGDAVIATDLSGRITFMNDVAEKLTGWTLSEASQKTVKHVFRILSGETRQEIENPVNRVLKEGMIVGLANHTILVRKDKKEVPIDDSGAPIRNKEEKITGVVLIFRDITQRKKAEDMLEEYRRNLEKLVKERTEKLERSNKKINEILESIYEGFYVLNHDWNFVYANKQITSAIGMKPEDWVGKNIWKIFPKYVGKPIETEFRAAMEKHEIRRFESTSEYSGVTYLVTASPSIEGISVLATDITERKKLEKQLQDQGQLAAIGATAGMVGHDIRNPLQAIVSELYFAKQAMAEAPKNVDTHDALESIKIIQEQVDYISKIVSDLQDFARPLAPKLEEIHLDGIIETVLTNLDTHGNVTVKHCIEADFPILMADPVYLRRILTNLATNAVQAMPKGGKLTITAAMESGKARIIVEDTGEGIPEGVRGKLFTPLVTTKAKGQGFGLSVVKRFAEALGGTVSFESELGKGTKFTIELPV